MRVGAEQPGRVERPRPGLVTVVEPAEDRLALDPRFAPIDAVAEAGAAAPPIVLTRCGRERPLLARFASLAAVSGGAQQAAASDGRPLPGGAGPLGGGQRPRGRGGGVTGGGTVCGGVARILLRPVR